MQAAAQTRLFKPSCIFLGAFKSENSSWRPSFLTHITAPPVQRGQSLWSRGDRLPMADPQICCAHTTERIPNTLPGAAGYTACSPSCCPKSPEGAGEDSLQGVPTFCCDCPGRALTQLSSNSNSVPRPCTWITAPRWQCWHTSVPHVQLC